MFCSKCGTKAIDGAAFCQKCGAKLNQENRGEREPVSVPKQESGEKPITAVRITSESEQKSVKKEGMLVEKEPMQVVSSKPIKTSTAPIGTKEVPVPEPVAISTVSNESPQIPSSESAEAPVPSVKPAMETVRDINEEELSSMPGNDADVYTLLKENTDKCPVIKSAKQFKKGVRLHGKIYRHTVRLVTAHTAQVRLRSVLAFPFSILYGLLIGLLCITTGIIFQEFIKYSSICIEYYHGILFSLCCLTMGAIILIHSFVGRKEKAAVTTYIRETVEPKGIYLFDRKRKGVFKVRTVAAVVLVVAGIILLPFSLPDPIEYPDELLFGGLPVTRFLDMTQKDLESEFGKAKWIGQNMTTGDDHYNYSYDGGDGISHVIYSKENGKVIYIQFDAIYCTYNRKKLNKSLDRVLDILSERYSGGNYSFGVYGSIHNGFGFYNDGVYFGETPSVEDYLAQQEVEDGRDWNYRFMPLTVFGEVYYDASWSLDVRKKQDYKIDLITEVWKNRDDLDGVDHVCLYTDEWVETVNAASIFPGQTYTNETDGSNTGEILYEGFHVSQFFVLPVDEVVELLGTPIDDEIKLIYDDIEFWVDRDNGRITSAEGFSLGKFTVNGDTLEKGRDELIALLGDPADEREGGSGHELEFSLEGCRLVIAVDEDVAWRIWVLPPEYQSGGDGVQDGTPQDSDDFWGEVGLSDFSYENLFLYSGSYGGINQTSIYVNIYSSFDEGNTVGNVFLYDSSGYETFVLIRDDNEGEGIYTLCLDDFTTMYIRFYQDSYGEYYADIQGLDAIYTNVNPVETYVMTEQYIP